METKTAKKVRTIRFNQNDLCFTFYSENIIQKEVTIKAGPKFIINTYLKAEYPNVGQIEKALNYIEYELTNHPELKNNDEQLVCTDEIFVESVTCNDKKLFLKSEIETIFDKYVDCATGEPAHLLGIKYSIDHLCTLLIVRVIMYYSNFDSIIIKE